MGKFLTAERNPITNKTYKPRVEKVKVAEQALLCIHVNLNQRGCSIVSLVFINKMFQRVSHSVPIEGEGCSKRKTFLYKSKQRSVSVLK